MAKVTSSYFDIEDTPELKFEEAKAQPEARLAANYAVAAHAPAYGVEADPYAELVQKQESMLKLQQELERTRREAQELEQRRAREDRFSEGRRSITEKLSRSLAKLDRELYTAQKAVEEISAARECYHHHLESLRSLQPCANGHHDAEEMDQAIGAVEDAENEFGKTSRRLAAVMPQLDTGAHAAAPGMPSDFATWLRCGLAFTLPLTVAAILVVLFFKLLP